MMTVSDYFPYKEATKFNASTLGYSGCGKTNLMCGLASIVRKLGYEVITIDPVGSWLDQSDLDFYQKIENPTDLIYPKNQESIIYDLSDLHLTDQQEFTSDFCESLWYYKHKNLLRPTILILEESHLFCKYLFSRSGNSVFRLVSAGRNPPYQIRVWSISQRPSALDTNLLELSQLLYVGYLTGENNLRKARSLFGKKYFELVETLETGEFLMRYGKEIKVIRVPKFERQSEPKDIEEIDVTYTTERPIPLSLIHSVLSQYR